MVYLKFIWKFKFPILSAILGLWLFLALSFPPSPVISGQSSIATQLKIVKEIKTVTKEVKVLVPTPEQTKKIEKDLGTTLPDNPLTIVKTDPLPNGGTIIPFLTPTGETKVQIIPSPPKRFQLLRQSYLELEYDGLSRGFDAGLGLDAIRIGRTTLGIKGGVQQEDSLEGLRVYVKGRIRVEF